MDTDLSLAVVTERKDWLCVLMIEIQVNELLKERGRTFYWLAKETGVSHTTLWRLKKGKAFGITFETLEKICQALECQPGDIVRLGAKKKGRKQNAKLKT